VNPEFANKLAEKHKDMDMWLCVTTPLGFIYHTNVTFENFVVNVDGKIIPTGLAQGMPYYSRNGLVG